MTEPTEPTWTGDDGHLKAVHAGYGCWVHPEPEPSKSTWMWQLRRDGVWIEGQLGVADSMEAAKLCALRAAEAMVVIDACKRGTPPESSGNRKDRDSLREAADAALDALLAGSACDPARAQRAVGLLRDAGADWSRHSDRLPALLLDPATEETLADTYALACARRACPGLVDEAALSLWKEEVGAGAVKQAYMDGMSVSRSLAVECDRLRVFVACLAGEECREVGKCPELGYPLEDWCDPCRARALLSDTATDEVTKVTQPDT